MPKNIVWKKGMRLSDELFRTADELTWAHIGQALQLAAGGSFGLFPGSHTFHVELGLRSNFVEVDSLECLAITRNGNLLDAHWDSKFTSNFDTRIPLPKENIQSSYYLIISVPANEKRVTSDGFCEPAYSLSLMESDSALPDNAFPIARLVYDYAWRIDDLDFVPPCLYVSSHPAFQQLCDHYLRLLTILDATCCNQLTSVGREAIAMLLPIIRQLRIRVDKERDTLTPMSLLGMVQECVCTFVTACDIFHTFYLDDAERWKNYVGLPYSQQDVHGRIKEGLDLCMTINEKLNTLGVAPPVVQAPPKPEPAKKKKNSNLIITIGK